MKATKKDNLHRRFRKGKDASSKNGEEKFTKWWWWAG